MEGFTTEVIAKPRFRTVGELREEALNRVTDGDVRRRINKLRADANVAIARCDKALGWSSQYYTPPPADPYSRSINARSATAGGPGGERERGAGVERSRHVGRILDVIR